MTFSETLEERNGYRVRLELENSPDEPYDCSGSPILRIDTGGYNSTRASFVDTSEMRPHEEDDYIINAIDHWQTNPSDIDWPKFEKYLRAFFGVRDIEIYRSQDYWYVTYDSEGWRRSLTTDGADGDFKPSMDEYKAWCEGECYYYAVERQETWHADSDPDVTMDTWEIVDSCGGFYGADYAREAALEAFVGEAGEKV
jgi:hypothetical protein